MAGFNVSLDVLHRIGGNSNLGQVCATFYGPLVGHVTSALLWVFSDGTLVTIVCQGQCYTASWGRSGGDSHAVKAQKKTDGTFHWPPTNRQKTR